MNSFSDSDEYSSAVVKARYYYEEGTREFVDFSKKMIYEYGDDIKPYLIRLWAGAKREPVKIEQVKSDSPVKSTNQKKDKERLYHLNKIKFIVIVLIIISFGNLPIGYYTFLRFAVSIVAIVSAYKYYKKNEETWTWIFGTVAVLFNPIIPIYFEKDIWGVIDVFTIIIFFISIINLHTLRVSKRILPPTASKKILPPTKIQIDKRIKSSSRIKTGFDNRLNRIRIFFQIHRKYFALFTISFEIIKAWSTNCYKYGLIFWYFTFCTPFITSVIILIYFLIKILNLIFS